MEDARRSLRLHDKRKHDKADEYENSYILNVEKSLNKKLDSAKRTSISHKMTDGGLTAQLDAVSFELFYMHVNNIIVTLIITMSTQKPMLLTRKET